MNKIAVKESKANPVIIDFIERVLYMDSVGNFNRIACRYKKRTHLVHSEAGDLGDPFRMDESYFNSLYIYTDQPCQWNLP